MQSSSSRPDLTAQIGRRDALVARQFTGGAFKHHSTLIEHVSVVRAAERQPRILFDDQHRHAVGTDRPDQFEMFATMSGARPSDGSSSRRTRGEPISARAMHTICCSPPDSEPAACLRRDSMIGKRSVT